jgi:hypothetical protein
VTDTRAAAIAETIDIDPSKPLLIVDADEVLFQFMAAFQTFIEEKGHTFIFRSYALAGNVLAYKDGPPLERQTVSNLVTEFFEKRTREIPADIEAAPALNRLKLDGFQIVVLSNVPSIAVEDRRCALNAANMQFPLAPWSGPKGTAVAALASKTQEKTVFVDDITSHHESVADLAPEVYRLHYVIHPKLRALLGKIEAANDQAENWFELEELIRDYALNN